MLGAGAYNLCIDQSYLTFRTGKVLISQLLKKFADKNHHTFLVTS